jgi:hypothetical protein
MPVWMKTINVTITHCIDNIKTGPRQFVHIVHAMVLEDIYKRVPFEILTPWSRVLLEKLTGFQLVKKFPAFYGTRRFITAATSAHHLSLS